MGITTRTKLILVTAGLAGIFAYLVIADLGISAGRIHRGVDVQGIDVGGLTPLEAAEKLDEIGRELSGPIVFIASEVAGFQCDSTPAKLGWAPRPFNTARNALAVGRSNAPFGALWDRARAWVAGVTVDWDDEPDPAKVDRFVARCVTTAETFGALIDRERLREMVVDLVGSWPYQQVHDLPLEG